MAVIYTRRFGALMLAMLATACSPKNADSGVLDDSNPTGKYTFDQLGLDATTYQQAAEQTRQQQGLVALDRAPDWLSLIAPDAVDYAWTDDVTQPAMDAGRELSQNLAAVTAADGGSGYSPDPSASDGYSDVVGTGTATGTGVGALALDGQPATPASPLAGALGAPLPAHEDCTAGGFCCQWQGKWYQGDTLLNSSDVIANATSCTGVQGACCIQAVKVRTDDQGIPIYGCNLPPQTLLSEGTYFKSHVNTDPTMAEPFYFDTSLEPSGVWSPTSESFEQLTGAASNNGVDTLTVGGDACNAQPPPPGVPATNFQTNALTSSDRTKTYNFTFHMGQQLAAATKAKVGTGGGLKFIVDGSVEVTLTATATFDETWQTTTTETTHLIPKTFYFGPCDAVQANSVFAILNHQVGLTMNNVAVCRLYQMTPAGAASRKVFGHRPLTNVPDNAGTVNIAVPQWTYTGEQCIWHGCGASNQQLLPCQGTNHVSQFAGIAAPVCANFTPAGYQAAAAPTTPTVLPTTIVPGSVPATPGAVAAPSTATPPVPATPVSPVGTAAAVPVVN